MPVRIEVIEARPRRCTRRVLELVDGSTVAAALSALPELDRDIIGYAVFGVRAEAATVLRDGDRLELLRGLQADPKDARRRRAATRAAR